MYEKISSRDNRKIKDTAKLISSTKYRRETGLFVTEGLRLCCDAAGCGVEINTLFVTDDAYERYGGKMAELISSAKEIFSVTEEVFSKISDTSSPQGVLAVCKTPDIERNAERITSNGRYVICENVSDPSNLGAISRTAEALGVNGMVIVGNGCDPFGPKAQRSAMGSLLRLPLYKFGDIKTAYEFLHNRSITVYASVVDREAKKVMDITFDDGSAVVIGNEGNGLTDEAKRICDRQITIPITGRAESFNAAAAAAILLWELMK